MIAFVRAPLREFYLFAWALLISGCASLPPQLPAKSVTPIPPVSVTEISQFQLAGRVAVKYADQGFSGSLRWRHDHAQDDILLLNPLGQGVAHILSTPTGVTLDTSDSQHYQARDAESLTQKILGWRLPLHGLRYWAQGMAAPDSPSKAQRDSDGHVTQLTQDGWDIEYRAYKDVSGKMLPGKIFMQRDDLEIKLLLDTWDLSSTPLQHP